MMHKTKMDWAANIEPGKSMFGLTIGLTSADVFNLLGYDRDRRTKVVTYSNSPRLVIEAPEEGVMLLRAADVEGNAYAWQNLLGRLIFQDGKLALIIADGDDGHKEPYHYRGKLFGAVGMGSPVADLLPYAKLKHDEDLELFYSDAVPGMELGGHSSLEDDPAQRIWHIRIYAHGKFDPQRPSSF